MNANRSNGNVEFECDFCGEVLFTEQDDFSEALAVLKEDGWRARKDKHGQWEHVCPDCQDRRS